MPFYEYICEKCNKEFVLLQTMSAKAEDSVCPYCNAKKARKLVSSFSSASAHGAVCSTGGHSWGGG